MRRIFVLEVLVDILVSTVTSWPNFIVLSWKNNLFLNIEIIDLYV